MGLVGFWAGVGETLCGGKGGGVYCFEGLEGLGDRGRGGGLDIRLGNGRCGVRAFWPLEA